jgi:putative ABC transport system substrate-binding protein
MTICRNKPAPELSSALTIVLVGLLAIHGIFCTPVPAAEHVKKIVFIRANLKPEPGSIMVDAFKSTLRKRGYAEGENIEYFDILIQKPGSEALQEVQQATDLHRDSADLLVSAGWVTLPVRKNLAESTTPMLFAPVLKEEALRILPSLTDPPGINLTGVYLAYPPEKILRLAQQVLPGIRNYAYVFDSRISTDLVIKEAFEGLREAERLGMSVHFLDLSAGVAQVVQQLNDLRIQAFGGIIGAYKNREPLAASGVPMITALLMDIDENGVADRVRGGNILAGLFNSLSYCGTQAGEIAADYLDGVHPLAATVPRPARQVTFVNMATAGRLRVAVPFAVLEAVDIVVK